MGALLVVVKTPPLHFFDPVFMRLLVDMIQPTLTDRGCTHDHNGAELTNHSNIIVGQRLGQMFGDFEANRDIPSSFDGVVSLEIKLFHINPLFPAASDTCIRVFESLTSKPSRFSCARSVPAPQPTSITELGLNMRSIVAAITSDDLLATASRKSLYRLS